ncbi:hypothetical protein FALB51S_01834 [Frigidibacter albus]
MDYTSIDDFLARGRGALAKGPVALILAEDLVEVDSTLRHHLKAGFRAVLLFAPPELDLPADLSAQIHRITYQVKAEGALVQAVNPIIAASPPTTWIYYGYNAEYLFHPFCETRSVRELIAFHAEERRDAMLCYVVDLYAGDLWAHPDAVDLDSALMDRTGYYALARKDEAGHIHERRAGFLRRHPLAVRGAYSQGPPAHRPHRAVPGPAGTAPAPGPHLYRSGIQHLRLPLAQQHDGNRHVLPHRQGTEDQSRVNL